MCFSESLATTCMSLRNKLCVARPTLIDSNLIGLNYYPFIVILDKCNGSCNAISDIARKICFPSKTKNVNVKEFNTITRTVEAKMLVKRISCNCKCNSNSSTSNSNQKWDNDVNVNVKSIVRVKKIIV